MKKIEAATLAEAYEQAARELNCSVTDMSYEVIQHPSNGILGFMKKNAIIVADCKRVAQAPSATGRVVADETKRYETAKQVVVEKKHIEMTAEVSNDGVTLDEQIETKTTTVTTAKPRKKHHVNEALTDKDDAVLGSFFDESEEESGELETKVTVVKTVETKEKDIVVERPTNNNLELAEEIESKLKELLSHSCFEIDTVEVDVVDNTALIFIDGDDAALLIGKEGYRYNALSYMLFNWLYSNYNLYIKLEIAQFLTSQQEMIRSYIEPVIEHVKANGKGKTRPLDGILVQIALEQLREAFPDKYVAVKTTRDGRRFVLINEFNTRSNA